jgi:hypothetical protein
MPVAPADVPGRRPLDFFLAVLVPIPNAFEDCARGGRVATDPDTPLDPRRKLDPSVVNSVDEEAWLLIVEVPRMMDLDADVVSVAEEPDGPVLDLPSGSPRRKSLILDTVPIKEWPCDVLVVLDHPGGEERLQDLVYFFTGRPVVTIRIERPVHLLLNPVGGMVDCPNHLDDVRHVLVVEYTADDLELEGDALLQELKDDCHDIPIRDLSAGFLSRHFYFNLINHRGH